GWVFFFHPRHPSVGKSRTRSLQAQTGFQFVVTYGLPRFCLLSGARYRVDERRIALAGVPLQVLVIKRNHEGDRMAIPEHEDFLDLTIPNRLLTRGGRGEFDFFHGLSVGVAPVPLNSTRRTWTTCCVSSTS